MLSTTKLCTSGYVIENDAKKPDPERIEPLLRMPAPESSKALQRCLGLFSNYAQGIRKFSDKIAPLLGPQEFPLSPNALGAFETLRSEIANSVVTSIDES